MLLKCKTYYDEIASSRLAFQQPPFEKIPAGQAPKSETMKKEGHDQPPLRPIDRLWQLKNRVEEEMLRSLKTLLPTELGNKDYLKEKLYQVLIMVSKKAPVLLPVVLEPFLDVLDKMPFCIMFDVKYFSNEPWSEAFFRKMAQKGNIHDLVWVSRLKEKKYYGDLLQAAVTSTARHNPAYLFEFLNNSADAEDGESDEIQKQSYYSETLRMAAFNCAEKSPPFVLKYHELLEKQLSPLDYERVLELAAKNGISNLPGTQLRYIKAAEGRRYYAEVLKKTFYSALEKDLEHVFEKIALIKSENYYNDVLDQAIQRALKGEAFLLIFFFPVYQDRADARKILLQAIDSDPWYFVRYYRQPEDPENDPASDKYAVLKTIKQFLGPEADPIFEKQKSRIKIAEKGADIPSKLVQSGDFPINPEQFNLWLLGVNHRFFKETRDSGYPRIYISIPLNAFRKIFLSEPFQDFLKRQAGQIRYANAFSYAHAVYRLLDRQRTAINPESVKKAMARIEKAREKIKNRELFGPNTRLILFTHQESRYDNAKLVENIYQRSGGEKENIVTNVKGRPEEAKNRETKELVLKAIRESEGDTTIIFNGHGGKTNWSFSGNETYSNESLTASPNNINYVELGDALMRSGNISNINLVGMACFAYDYFKNLFGYLESRGFIEKPCISIAGANFDRLHRGGGKMADPILFDSIYRMKQEGQSITVQDFINAEPDVWQYEDPALFTSGDEKDSPESPRGEKRFIKPKNFLEIGQRKKDQQDKTRFT